jgi:ornithine carbamoyltransferase
VPVINGLTAYSHPCQIVADLMTFEEHKGTLAGQKLAWLGDGNNVALSFVHAAAQLDFELALATPADFSIADAEIKAAQAKGAKITLCETAEDAAEHAAALMTDCWVSMSDDPAEAQSRATAFGPYQVTQDLMARGDAPIFMHCLPAYRGSEVTAEVIDGVASVIFDEAENRAHAQKAVMLHCMGAELDC